LTKISASSKVLDVNRHNGAVHWLKPHEADRIGREGLWHIDQAWDSTMMR